MQLFNKEKAVPFLGIELVDEGEHQTSRSTRRERWGRIDGQGQAWRIKLTGSRRQGWFPAPVGQELSHWAEAAGITLLLDITPQLPHIATTAMPTLKCTKRDFSGQT